LLRVGASLHIVGMALRLAALNVEEIAMVSLSLRAIMSSKSNEGFFLELDYASFCRSPQADASFRWSRERKVIFPLRIDDVKNDAGARARHQLEVNCFSFCRSAW